MVEPHVLFHEISPFIHN